MLKASPKKVTAYDVAADRSRGGEVRVLLSPTTVAATSGFMGVVRLDAGHHVSEHYHPYSEEFIYVVRGRLVVRCDGEPVELNGGDALLIPIGVRHHAENTGDELVEAVFHLCPLAPRPELGHVDTKPPKTDVPPPEVTKS